MTRAGCAARHVGARAYGRNGKMKNRFGELAAAGSPITVDVDYANGVQASIRPVGWPPGGV
jgi:hypothetical protein